MRHSPTLLRSPTSSFDLLQTLPLPLPSASIPEHPPTRTTATTGTSSNTNVGSFSANTNTGTYMTTTTSTPSTNTRHSHYLLESHPFPTSEQSSSLHQNIDKFTDKVESGEPIFSCFQSSRLFRENILSSNFLCETMKDRSIDVVSPVDHRDIGTEMTPFGSSTTSRCHTPIKTSSPARHNTPADRSGLLVLPPNPSIVLSELNGCHLAKLELGSHFDSVFSNWSSKEEEEEEISKSLRHSEMDGGRKSIAESRAVAWEDEERVKSCIRYQREEAKIQAWLNLQSAKAEAKFRKLEVKIQKMRSNLEEKLMSRMTTVQRKAEEWRAAAQLQHSQQIQRAQEQAQKMKSKQPSHFYEDKRCGCLPCNSSNSY